MSEHSNENGKENPQDRQRRFGGGRGWGPFAVVMVALIAAASGAFATKAASYGYGHWRHADFMHGPLNPGKIEKRAERLAKHLAVETDATAEQQDKLVGIAKALAKDLLPMREQIRAARQKGRELFTQTVIDRDQIEAFRTEQIALADTVTKHVTKAFADAADVLTAEQRKALAERFPRHRGFGRNHN